MLTKRIILALAALMLALTPALAAVAEAATKLPLGVDFTMDYETVRKTLGEGVEEDVWEDGCGMLMQGGCDILGIAADGVQLQVDRNNSASASRLTQIAVDLSVDGGCIAAFRAALASLTAEYGAPDDDPFNEAAVESYVESGNLSASWTKTDVRINLYMNRMNGEYMILDFTNRLCYDPNDLK